MVLLLDAEGNVTEGPGFNVFAFLNKTLFTPAGGVLEGITRRTVLELAEENGIQARLDMFGPHVLERAEEIFISSTAGGVMPVTALDGIPVGNGKPGPITGLLRERYWKAHEEDRWTTPVDYPSTVKD
jgi:branched-chain amino acid aminotransferase